MDTLVFPLAETVVVVWGIAKLLLFFQNQSNNFQPLAGLVGWMAWLVEWFGCLDGLAVRMVWLVGLFGWFYGLAGWVA